MTTGRTDLERVYAEQSSRVHGFLLDRCGSRALAEELTAQTFEAAARQVARGRSDDVTAPWLFTVARRRLIDHWRRQGARERLRERVAAESVVVSQSPASENPEVSAALDSLGHRQRVVLTLRYIDGWSVSEIAEALEITYVAAQSLLARARTAFRAALVEETS